MFGDLASRPDINVSLAVACHTRLCPPAAPNLGLHQCTVWFSAKVIQKIIRWSGVAENVRGSWVVPEPRTRRVPATVEGSRCIFEQLTSALLLSAVLIP